MSRIVDPKRLQKEIDAQKKRAEGEPIELTNLAR